jgi:hypothetical protein
MYASNGNITPSQPSIISFLVRPGAYRHPKAWGGVSMAAGLWVFVLGVILCSYGFWWGTLLILVAALEIWVACRLLRSTSSGN